MRQAELNHALPVQLVEQLELTGQLVRLLPLGGEFCPFFVVVVVGQVIACVGIPAEGPETVEVDLITHGRGQRVHEDSCAEAFGGKVFGLPVPVRKQNGAVLQNYTPKTLISPNNKILSLVNRQRDPTSFVTVCSLSGFFCISSVTCYGHYVYFTNQTACFAKLAVRIERNYLYRSVVSSMELPKTFLLTF